MLARRPTLTAVVLLVVGWGASASLAPAFRSFMLDRLHSGCFYDAPAWFCEDDPFPRLVVPFTELVLAAVLLLAVVLVVSLGRRRRGGGRRRIALGGLVLLPGAYVLLLVAGAVAALDPTDGAAQHLGDFWWLASSAAIAIVVASVATLSVVLASTRARASAAVAGVALIALLLVGPGLAWLVPLGLALVASLLLTAPFARQEEPVPGTGTRVAGRA